jgi:hypothetical protein
VNVTDCAVHIAVVYVCSAVVARSSMLLMRVPDSRIASTDLVLPTCCCIVTL